MADLDDLLTRVASEQQKAAVSVLLPALFTDPTSSAALKEWNLFNPVAAQFAQQAAPNTAFSNPVLFLNWVFNHPSGHGIGDYSKYIVSQNNLAMEHSANNLLDSAMLRTIQQTVNGYGILIPDQNFF